MTHQELWMLRHMMQLETDDKFRYIRISKTYRGSEESTKGSPSNMMVSISHLDPHAGSNLFLTGFQIESGEEVTDFVRTVGLKN